MRFCTSLVHHQSRPDARPAWRERSVSSLVGKRRQADSSTHLSGHPSRRDLTAAIHLHNDPRPAGPPGLRSAESADRRDESEPKCRAPPSTSSPGRSLGSSCRGRLRRDFDIQVLPGLRWTTLGFQDRTFDGILIAPTTVWQPGALLRSFDREGTGC